MKSVAELIDELDYEGNIIATHPKEYLRQRMFLHKVSLVIPTANNNELVLSKKGQG